MGYALTIIMSNYNQEKYISKAIDSVLVQKTNFEWNLIITDDHSTEDNSIGVIKAYAEKYPEKITVLLNEDNGRYLKNILRAKAITKTPYFCLLDADDYYTDDGFLQRAYDFLETHNEYVIYYENVNCLHEDGSVNPFVSLSCKTGTYDINNYLANDIPIVQTTGQFYRNVIFKYDIPQIITDAIGTFSERSFEGDFDRFIIHLKYGKAFFNNRFCGVYRILKSVGIWASSSDFDRALMTWQSYYDYNRYYENKYKEFFVNKMYNEMCRFVNVWMGNIYDVSIINGGTPWDAICKNVQQINILYNYIIDNKELIRHYESVDINLINVSGKELIKILKKVIRALVMKVLKKMHLLKKN